MRSLPLLMLLPYLLLFCSSNEEISNRNNSKELPENLIEVTPPSDSDYTEGRVYITHVERITFEESPALVIHGSLPDGCSRLLNAELDFESEDLVTIRMSSWRPADAACTQALVDFSYVFEKADNRLNTVSSYEFNNERAEIE